MSELLKMQPELKSLAATALVAVSLSINGAIAEEIKLRCDPTSAPKSPSYVPTVLSIDTDKKIVHMGNDSDHGWYFNGRPGRGLSRCPRSINI
jgi:hypothetical protein